MVKMKKRIVLLSLLLLLSITLFAGNEVKLGSVTNSINDIEVIVYDTKRVSLEFEFWKSIGMSFEEVAKLDATLSEVSKLIAISEGTDIIYKERLDRVRINRGYISIWITFVSSVERDIIRILIEDDHGYGGAYGFVMTTDELRDFRTLLQGVETEYEGMQTELRKFKNRD